MKEKNEAAPTMVAQINQANIVIIENDKKQVASKPIYKPLGMNNEAQRQKIQHDVIWGSLTLQSKAVRAQRKDHDRITIPIQYVFGRPFTNLRSKAKEAPFAIDLSGKKGGLL